MSEPLRILVVEDEAAILMQIEMTLEDAGHMVVGTAVTAGEAIALINQTHPELVLIDLRLGDGSSGLDVADAVRAAEGISAAFMTANDRQLSDDLHGSIAVIAKPFTSSLLEDALVYLEQCVRRPPPSARVPRGMRVAPGYSMNAADEARKTVA